jgi:hypothetical protein
MHTLFASWRHFATTAKRFLAIVVSFRSRAFALQLRAWRDTAATLRHRRSLFLQLLRRNFAVRLCQRVFGRGKFTMLLLLRDFVVVERIVVPDAFREVLSVAHKRHAIASLSRCHVLTSIWKGWRRAQVLATLSRHATMRRSFLVWYRRVAITARVTELASRRHRRILETVWISWLHRVRKSQSLAKAVAAFQIHVTDVTGHDLGSSTPFGGRNRRQKRFDAPEHLAAVPFALPLTPAPVLSTVGSKLHSSTATLRAHGSIGHSGLYGSVPAFFSERKPPRPSVFHSRPRVFSAVESAGRKWGRFLLWKAFNSWRFLHALCALKHERNLRLLGFHNRRVVMRSLCVWTMYLAAQRLVKAAIMFHSHHAQRKSFKRWKRRVARLKRHRNAVRRCVDHHIRAVCGKALSGWKRVALRRGYVRAVLLAHQQAVKQRRLQFVFTVWARVFVRIVRSDVVALNYVIQKWLRYVALTRIANQRANTLSTLCKVTQMVFDFCRAGLTQIVISVWSAASRTRCVHGVEASRILP